MLYVDLFDSKAIAMFAYDIAARSLLIHFKAGGVYAYQDVPRVVFEGFRDAPSKGQYFQAEIRDRFAGRRLAPSDVAQFERARARGGAFAMPDLARIDIATLERSGRRPVFF